MVARQTEAYVISNVGTVLLLKLCGFVEASRAEIRDVSETHVRLHLGGSWLSQLWGSSRQDYPMEIEIHFQPVEAGANHSRPQAFIQITVQDARCVSRQDHFDVAAKRVLWKLRSHLMV